GISEPLLNRFGARDLILMRPLPPKELQSIADLVLKELKNDFSRAEGAFGPLNLEWASEVPVVLREYKYVPEDTARPIEFNVRDLIKATIEDAFASGEIEPAKEPRTLSLSVEKNDDLTWDLVISVQSSPEEQEIKKIRQKIKATEYDKPAQPISDRKIQE